MTNKNKSFTTLCYVEQRKLSLLALPMMYLNIKNKNKNEQKKLSDKNFKFYGLKKVSLKY